MILATQKGAPVDAPLALPIIDIKHHNGPLHPAVLEVGGGDDNAVLVQ